MLEPVLTGAVAGGTSHRLRRRSARPSPSAPGSSTSAPRARCSCGALAAYAVGIETGNPWLGVARRARSPAPRWPRCTPSWCCTAGANQIATGLVVTLPRPRPHRPVRPGLRRPGRRAARRPGPIPGLSRPAVPRADPVRPRPAHLPVVPRRPARAWWLLFRTRTGLMVRAAGERPEVLRRSTAPRRPKVRCVAVAARRRAWPARRRPAVDRLHPQLVREHDRRPGLRGRGPRDLRRLEPAQGHRSAPTCSAAPIALQLQLQAAGLGHLPLPARVPALRRSSSSCSPLLEPAPGPRRPGGARARSSRPAPDRARRPARSPPTPTTRQVTPSQGATPCPVHPRPRPAARARPRGRRRRLRRQRRPPSASADGGAERPDGDFTVGFIYVGPKDDFGYNQAAYEGSQAVGEGVPRRQGPPGRERARDGRGRAGHGGHDRPGRRRSSSPPATATSSSPQNVAERNPDVVVRAPGRPRGRPGARQPRHLLRHRVRARVPRRHRRRRGHRDRTSSATSTPSRSRRRWPTSTPSRSAPSRSNPDVETIDDLHRQLVRPGQSRPRRPRASSTRTSTSSPSTRTAPRRSSRPPRPPAPCSVGYHADASELAPKGWITGSEWNWGPLYTDIVETVDGRRLRRQRVQRRLPGRPADRRQPVRPVAPTARWSTDGHQGHDRRGQAELRRRRLAVRRPGHRPGRRGGRRRGRAAHLRRDRDDGLLRRGRRRHRSADPRRRPWRRSHPCPTSRSSASGPVVVLAARRRGSGPESFDRSVGATARSTDRPPRGACVDRPVGDRPRHGAVPLADAGRRSWPPRPSIADGWRAARRPGSSASAAAPPWRSRLAIRHPPVVGGLVLHEPLRRPHSPRSSTQRFARGRRQRLARATPTAMTAGPRPSWATDDLDRARPARRRRRPRRSRPAARAEVAAVRRLRPDASPSSRPCRRSPVAHHRRRPQRHRRARAAAEVLAPLRPAPSSSTVAGAGNAVQLDAPDAFAELIATWQTVPRRAHRDRSRVARAPTPTPGPTTGASTATASRSVLAGWDDGWAERGRRGADGRGRHRVAPRLAARRRRPRRPASLTRSPTRPARRPLAARRRRADDSSSPPPAIDGFYGGPLDDRAAPHGPRPTCSSPATASRARCTRRSAAPTTAATSACCVTDACAAARPTTCRDAAVANGDHVRRHLRRHRHHRRRARRPRRPSRRPDPPRPVNDAEPDHDHPRTRRRRALRLALRRRDRPAAHRADQHRLADRLLRPRRLRRRHGLRPQPDPRRPGADRARCSTRARAAGMLVIHTREGHLPDLSRLPAQQAVALEADRRRHRRRRARAAASSCGASPAGTSSPRCTRSTGEVDHRQARQGRVLRHRPRPRAAHRGHHPHHPHRHHHRRLRAHDHARGQRPRLRVPAARGLHRRHRPRQLRGGAARW